MASIIERTTIPFQGLCPYGVKIDPSEELTSLIEQASKLRDLPFAEKMKAVTEIAVNAMENAYEGYVTNTEKPDLREKYRKIVFELHTLSDALKQEAGCCRYQATLFLVLSAAAELGDQHYLQSAPAGRRVSTCFNDVVHDGKVHHVSIFCTSLKDKRIDYSKDPSLFEKPNFYVFGQLFLSYAKNADGVVVPDAKKGYHRRISATDAIRYQSLAHDLGKPAQFFKNLKIWTS